MVITHVVLSLDCGGLERVVLDLVQAGQKRGQRVAVVCLDRPGVLADRVTEAGAQVVCIGKGAGITLRTVRRLQSVLGELRPDVVHSHQIGALFYAGPAARSARVPVVVHTEHGKHYADFRNRFLGRMAGCFASQFFCVSEDVAADVIARRIVPRSKVKVVPNGINTSAIGSGECRSNVRASLGVSRSAPLVGTVGRLNEIKRQDLLIRAFSRVRNEVPDAHLLLVGDGPLMTELTRLADELDLSRYVHFAGYQANPEQYLAAMDIFALTSRSEGMPLSVLEAWAARVPVIASRVGGLPEMITEELTGLLFESGDEIALAKGLLRLISDPALCSKVSQAGRDRVTSSFSVETMAAEYERHYLIECDRSSYVGQSTQHVL